MVVDQWRGLQASATTGQEVGARLKGKQGVMVGRKRLGDDGITWPEGGNINMMHGDSRVMDVAHTDAPAFGVIAAALAELGAAQAAGAHSHGVLSLVLAEPVGDEL